MGKNKLNLFKNKKILLSLSISVCLVGAGTYLLSAKKGTSHSAHHGAVEEAVEEGHHSSKEVHNEHATHTSQNKNGVVTQILVAYRDFFKDLQHSVTELMHLDDENQKLKLENLQLLSQLESVKQDCRVETAKNQTKKMSVSLNMETGSTMGRTLSSIRYMPPENLLPQQLYPLAFSYFKAGDFEKSAVIFTYLTGSNETKVFQNPKNYLLTGVSWFNLKHYKEAEFYFKKILNAEPAKETLPLQAQTRLWQALIAHQKGNTSDVQSHLLDLLSHHPHSVEVRWVNGHRPETRKIASEDEESSNTIQENIEEKHGVGEVMEEPLKEHGDHEKDNHNSHH